MNLTLDGHKLIQIFLGCLILASMPVLFFVYLAALVLLTKIFIVICIIDFISKTSIRKRFGLFLISVYLAYMVSLVIFYFTYQQG